MKTFALYCLMLATALAAPSGRPQFQRGRGMIVGGTDAAPGELPYQVSYQDTKWGHSEHICGASVYSERWIICAAHCVIGNDYENPTFLQIAAGENNLEVDEGTEQIIPVSRIILHEDYDDVYNSNDISLLQLASPLTFNDYVQPIALPAPMQQSTGDALVSGWGTSGEYGNGMAVLQKVSVPIVSDKDCREAYGKTDVKDSMLCAGTKGRDSCQGDSGGPLVCQAGNSTYLCGVVSWGYGCARPKIPGVYTEVSYFVDWIEENTGVMM